MERLKALKERHAALERRVAQEATRLTSDQAALKILKIQKLRIKDEMERLRRSH